jgi:hypothetical protein
MKEAGVTPLKYYSSIWLEGVMTTTGYLSHDSLWASTTARLVYLNTITI